MFESVVEKLVDLPPWLLVGLGALLYLVFLKALGSILEHDEGRNRNGRERGEE